MFNDFILLFAGAKDNFSLVLLFLILSFDYTDVLYIFEFSTVFFIKE